MRRQSSKRSRNQCVSQVWPEPDSKRSDIKELLYGGCIKSEGEGGHCGQGNVTEVWKVVRDSLYIESQGIS